MFSNRRTIVKKPQINTWANAFENGKLKKGYRHIKGGGKIKDSQGNIIVKP